MSEPVSLLEALAVLAKIASIGFVVGFALSFGAFAGLLFARALYGPIQVSVNTYIHARPERLP